MGAPKPAMSCSITPTTNGLFVVVRPSVKRFPLFFIPIWIAGWIWVAWAAPPQGAATMFEIVAFGLVSIVFGYTCLWMVWGREELVITPLEMVYRRMLFLPFRKRTFRADRMASPRFVQSEVHGMGGRVPSGIAFLYDGRHVKICEGLGQREAKALVQEISRLSPEWAECWSGYEPGHLEPHDPLRLDLEK